jgi:maltose alpha-D-glucosyltransferase/alpha-amylase
VRSIEYAAVKVLLDPTRVRDADFDRASRWAFLWSSWASAAFLQSYFLSAGQSRIITPDLGETMVLFDAFVLERTLYQVQGELETHPDGALVPLLSLQRLLGSPEKQP